MKISNIKVGDFYYDGKDGIREVLTLDLDDAGIERVEYRILAAKASKKYSYGENEIVSVIGKTSSCHLESFAAWAKTQLSKPECDDLLNFLAAKKVKLSPGELAFMESALDEAGGAITKGTTVSFNHMEGRAVSGLAKKGLVVRQSGEVEITDLGASWFRYHAQKRIEN